MLSKRFIRAATLAAALLLPLAAAFPARAHTRDEVRAAYRQIRPWSEDSPYAEPPSTAAPYAEGALEEGAAGSALDALNFARWLAELSPVEESAIYDYQCRHGAVLLAALDYVDHNAPRPADMDGNFYDSAHLATSSGNIARFNWMRPSILREGVEYFLRDDGDENLAALGHRRWALNPRMAATGFGLANSASGMSYVVMYAHDQGRPDAEWDRVCWPSAGAFPAALMHGHLAWSVVLNPEKYDLAASDPRVTLSEESSGLRFSFHPAGGAGDGWCALNAEGYGAGPCLIFRPDFTGTDFTDYQQNQRWTVRVEGLLDAGGRAAALEYAVEMISLHAEDVVNVEIEPLRAELAPGETLRLRASVIPAYADDLSVAWRSTDDSVASVDADGLARAVGPGSCEIIATGAGGVQDACAVTVKQQ